MPTPKRFGGQLDLQKIPIIGLVPESSATAPTSPGNNQLWVDTSVTPNKLKVYFNGAWVGVCTLDATGKVAFAELPTGTTAGTVAVGNHNHDATYSPLGHTHAAADVVSGTFDIARLPVAASGTSSSTQVVRADDSRLTDSRAPSGPAGGDLTGTYPNPTIGAGKVDDTKVAAANKDGVAGTPSMRTLGTGAQQALAGNTRLDQIAAPTSAVSFNGQRLTNLATPTTGTDAVNKDYVDAARAGISWKESVRVVTLTNVNLASPGASLDGVAMAAGDRFLAAGQTTGTQNGIYVWNGAAVAATRATDADTSAELSPGTQVFVNEGTSADSTYALITNAPITLGTTSLTFTQTSGAGQITAGNGLSKNANDLSVNVDDSSIEINADTLRVKAGGITNAMLAGSIDLTTKVTGTLPVANGGTGATTAAGARTSLGAVGKYAADLGALTAGVETVITHNLNTTDVQAMFRSISSGYDEIQNWRVISANTIGVTADVAYAANSLRVVVVG